jgi:hypothetical protein
VQLLAEEWLSLRGLHDPRADAAAEILLAGKRINEGLGLGLGQWLQNDRVVAHAPPRALLEQMWSRNAEDEHRRLGDPGAEILDQVEQRRLGPVDVFENDDERTLPGQSLEETPDRPEDLAGGRTALGSSGQLEHALRDGAGVRVVREQGGDRRVRPFWDRLLDDLRQRKVRRSLTVRHAPSDDG